ncbi:hypothetical protein M422DRAFT_242824 [Sphaerobolus stellatus SS14]|nr:hypothetical protein M422DRAFT_242824 [Sphaerobolus stellatus SS14]
MLHIEDVLGVPYGEGRVHWRWFMIHRPSWIHSRFTAEGAFVFTPHADFRAAMRNIPPFQPDAATATATANYRPPPPSQSCIFALAIPVVVSHQVYNYHAIYEAMPEGMGVEAEAIGLLWVEVLTLLQQVRWWRAVDLREIGMDVRLMISLVKQMPQHSHNTPGASRKKWVKWLMRWRRWGGEVL